MLGEFGAAHERHPQVGQQQVDGLAVLIEHLHRFLTVARFVDAIAGARQRLREQLPHGRFVLDQQNRFARVCRRGLPVSAASARGIIGLRGYLPAFHAQLAVVVPPVALASASARSRFNPACRSSDRSIIQHSNAHDNPISHPARTSVG